LGLAYYHIKDTINAQKWSKKALNLSGLSNDLVAKTQSWLTLSFIEKDLNKSVEYAEQSVKYSDKLDDRIHMAVAYYGYADALNKVGEREQALNYAKQAVEFAEKVGDNITLAKAAHTVADIYFKAGMREKSARFFYTYSILTDSIASVDKAKAINEINIKYETEKKEKRIVEQELKIQKQRSNLSYAILGGAFLVFVFGGFFIYNWKTQKLKLKQLQQEKENAILNSFILGEERERKRISQELHDGVAAMIGAVKMSLESMPHLSHEKQIEQFAKVKQILEST